MEITEEERIGYAEVSERPYAFQAKRFLNTFWHKLFRDAPAEREKVWAFAHHFQELDTANGSALDEFQAHRFLEKAIRPMTIQDLRRQLAEIEVDNNKRLSLAEYLMFHYKDRGLTWAQLGDWQSTSSAEANERIAAAEAEMATAQKAVEATQAAAAEARSAAATAQDEAAKAAKEEEANNKAGAAAAEAAAALEAEEKAKEDAIAEQELAAADTSLSTVKKCRAKAQLAILQNEDSQPLRTARITQQAAARKALKTAKVFAAAAEQAAAAKTVADEAAAAAAAKVEAASAAVARVEKKLAAAANCGDEGAASGTLWWLDREFEEAKKYMSAKMIAKAESQRSSDFASARTSFATARASDTTTRASELTAQVTGLSVTSA